MNITKIIILTSFGFMYQDFLTNFYSYCKFIMPKALK